MGQRFGELWLTISIIEKGHLFAIKRFLYVSTRTPSALVYGETGRYPLHVNTYTRCINYWLNLVRMPDNRLPSKSYKMVYGLHVGFFLLFFFFSLFFLLHCIDTASDSFGKTRECVTRKDFCSSLDSN